MHQITAHGEMKLSCFCLIAVLFEGGSIPDARAFPRPFLKNNAASGTISCGDRACDSLSVQPHGSGAR